VSAPAGIAIGYVAQLVTGGDGRAARGAPGGEQAAGVPIAELADPFALEVQHPIVIGSVGAGLPVLPPYIRREHDRGLDRVVERAAGGRSGIAVLVGGSSTGKTRACWEAVHTLPPGWRLWHAIFPDRAEALLAGLEQVAPQTVVWLNEAQFYLLTGNPAAGERVAAGLRDLLRDPRRGPVLVLGTIWPRYWQALTAPPDADGDPHAHARELLADASIEVPGDFTGPALAALAAAAGADPRLAAAREVKDGQVTQFLAGVPVLLERYRTAPPLARALIDVALDARTLGHGPALPLALLEAAAPWYLTDQQWEEDAGEDWLEQALAYTATPCRGARGPLTRIRPRPGDPVPGQPHYRLADYLEETQRAAQEAGSAPAALWDALLVHAARHDLAQIATSARSRGLYRYAFQLYVADAEAGRMGALNDVAWMLEETGRTEEAIIFHQQAAEAGVKEIAEADLEEIGRTLAQRIEDGEYTVTTGTFQRHGYDTGVLEHAARMLEEAGLTEEAITRLRARTTSASPSALEHAARMLEEAGLTEEAARLRRYGIEPGGRIADPWEAIVQA
jgi:hypothetical protein